MQILARVVLGNGTDSVALTRRTNGRQHAQFSLGVLKQVLCVFVQQMQFAHTWVPILWSSYDVVCGTSPSTEMPSISDRCLSAFLQAIFHKFTGVSTLQRHSLGYIQFALLPYLRGNVYYGQTKMTIYCRFGVTRSRAIKIPLR